MSGAIITQILANMKALLILTNKRCGKFNKIGLYYFGEAKVNLEISTFKMIYKERLTPESTYNII